MNRITVDSSEPLVRAYCFRGVKRRCNGFQNIFATRYVPFGLDFVVSSSMPLCRYVELSAAKIEMLQRRSLITSSGMSSHARRHQRGRSSNKCGHTGASVRGV
jgi:hypothetical protein